MLYERARSCLTGSLDDADAETVLIGVDSRMEEEMLPSEGPLPPFIKKHEQAGWSRLRVQ